MTRQRLRIRIPGEEQYAALLARHRCKDRSVCPSFHENNLYSNQSSHIYFIGKQCVVL